MRRPAGSVGGDKILQPCMRELRGDAVIGLVQSDSDPRPGLVGKLPRHGQPMRRLDLGHVAAAQTAWVICAAMTHNLLRAAATLGPSRLAVARGATLRRQIINVPARIARPQRRRVLHLPQHWPRAQQWLKVWRGVFGEGLAPPLTT